MNNKTCTKCGKGFPATKSYFHARNSIKCRLKSRCKTCRSKDALQYQKTESCRQSAKRRRMKYNKSMKGYIAILFNNMMNRCTNQKHPKYKYYGGKGVKCLFESIDDLRCYVVDRLKIDPRGLDCDRINNNGHYERGNIQFITHKENVRK